MTFGEFKMYGEEAGIPYCVIKLTWEMRQEYHSLPAGEKYIMRAVWKEFKRRTPADVMAGLRAWDDQHPSDETLEYKAALFELRQLLAAGKPPRLH